MKKPEVSPEALTTLRHLRTAALLSTLILFSIKSAKEKDQIFPLEHGIYLSKKIQAPLVVIPDTGHGVTNEQPEMVIHLIKNFIDSEKR